MKFHMILAAALALALTACGEPPNAQERVQAQTSKTYNLNADERGLAQTNAKQFFEKEWPLDNEGSKARGVWIECRPSDSNFNGMVTCNGKVPRFGGGFDDVKRYCGYKPDLVGCSDEDTVK